MLSLNKLSDEEIDNRCNSMYLDALQVLDNSLVGADLPVQVIDALEEALEGFDFTELVIQANYDSYEEAGDALYSANREDF